MYVEQVVYAQKHHVQLMHQIAKSRYMTRLLSAAKKDHLT